MDLQNLSFKKLGITLGRLRQAESWGLLVSQYSYLGKFRPVDNPVLKKRKKDSWAMVVHAFNPSSWEAEAGGSL